MSTVETHCGHFLWYTINMIIETKYDIGANLFYTRNWENKIEVKKGTIRSINTGGKAWEEYDLGGTTRAEGELYETFDKAKEKAIELQVKQNEKLLEWVNEITEQSVRRD
jgi:hypothetical protein